MPNNVDNYLTLEGSEASIHAFFEKAKTDEQMFDFNGFVPMPPEVFTGNLGEEEDKKYPGEKNWYNWSLKYWGTKWNAYDVVCNPPTCVFTTAWSVPLEVLIAASEQFPDLTITNEWIEETVESAGILILQNGSVLVDESESEEWSNKDSKYIHPLNLRHRKSRYLGYLQECAVDEPNDSIYHYYLDLATK